MKDEDKSPADLLEQALRDLETRKKAAADMAANMAPELERLDALQEKLDALPQCERRQVLDAMGLKHVSAAPRPITPLRGTGSAPSRQPLPANWNKWKFIPKCELWKAVCLTLDIEPNEEKHGMLSWLQSRRGVPYGFPEDFADRLQIAQANVSTNGPIHPQSLYVGVLKNPRAEVLLSEVAAASVRWGWTLPQAMQSLATPAAPVTTPEAETYPAIKKEGYVLKKAALIKKYSDEWPSIDADFNHASENGLTAAAKATGHGDWYESAVLAWADQRGKRTATEAKTAPNSVFNLPGTRHTLKG